VFDLLTSLVEESLVVYDRGDHPEGASRYGLLETVRYYGRDRLAAGEEAWQRKCHADHFRREHRIRPFGTASDTGPVRTTSAQCPGR
jgi:hypothetical protein